MKQFNEKIIAIDATRNKSGGAIVHIVSILNNVNPYEHSIQKIHIFSYDKILNQLPNFSWLVKHQPKVLNYNLIFQILWQKYLLPLKLKKIKCDLLFSTSAGSVCRFKPYVTMSQELLSFNTCVLKRYFFSKRWLRLKFLRSIQLSSFKHAKGIIFLNEYAHQVIQSFQAQNYNYKIVNHGISKKFDIQPIFKENLCEENEILLTYVSNSELYKNIDLLVQAVYELRITTNLPFKLKLLGAKSGHPNALKKLNKAILKYDRNLDFIFLTEKIIHEELITHLKHTDIFLFLSSVENMPNTLIEGMTAKLPIISSNIQPMPEMIKDGAIYINPENIKEIKDAVIKLCYDSNLRMQLSSKAYELSLKFSWEKCSKETFNFLGEILAN